MRQYGLRVLAGIIAFVIGFAADSIIYRVEQHLDDAPKVGFRMDYPNYFAEVRFKGFKESNGQIVAAVFEITNNSPMPMYYRSRSRETNAYNTVSVNGEDGGRAGYCGNVVRQMKEFMIEPNAAETFDVSLDRFRGFSEKAKNQNVKVGYDLRFDEFENYKTYWSEEIRLAEPVINQIKRY